MGTTTRLDGNSDLDGNVDNAFPWMSSVTTTTASPHTALPHNVSPYDNRDLPLASLGVPPTPGWVPPTPGLPVDPPRQARDGYEWVWYPEGFWAEREIGASSKGSGLDGKLRRWKGKSSSKGSQGSVDLDQGLLVARRGSGSSRRGSGGSSVGLFTPQPHTSFRTEREHVRALQHSSDNEPSLGHPSTPGTPSAGGGTDSGNSPAPIAKGFRRGSWPDTHRIIEETGEDDTSSQGSATPLGRLKAIGRSREKRKSRSSERGPADESPSESSDGHTPGVSSNARKLLGKQSWRKKETPADSEPLSLIEEETSSTTHSGQASWDSMYPGGEAKRITTPPLKEATADGRVRSMFTDVDDFGVSDAARSEADNRSQRSGLNNAGGAPSEPATVSSTEGPKLNMAYRNATAADATGGSHTHWSDSKRAEDEKNKRQRAGERRNILQSRQEAFALSVPEHYPNSPLCPANPKHVSGGTGVCVYHGRKQDLSKEKQPFVAELGLQQPVMEDQGQFSHVKVYTGTGQGLGC